MTTDKILTAKQANIGDRVSGVEHTCSGVAERCTKNKCVKFGGYVLDIVGDSVVIGPNMIRMRWIHKIYPDNNLDDSAVAAPYGIPVASSYAEPRLSPHSIPSPRFAQDDKISKVANS